MHEIVAAYLRTRFRSSLRGGELGWDDPLISSGVIDSFGVLELIAFLEDRFAITIDSGQLELTEFETVNRIVAIVDRVRQSA